MGGRQEEGRKGSETAEGVMNENERIQETATPPPSLAHLFFENLRRWSFWLKQFKLQVAFLGNLSQISE